MQLRRIKSDTRLARLFNSFMDSLSTLDIISDPAYYSMKVHARSINRELTDLETIHEAYQRFERYYQLCILSNGLRQFHSAVLEVEKLLVEYLDECAGDYRQFAIQNRIRSIEQYGGDDEDFNEDGSVRFTTDWESIKPYTLYHELTNYIGANYHESEGKCRQVRGEGLGTSRAEHYADFLLMVRNETAFSPLKYFAQQGIAIPMYRQNEEGEMEQFSLADSVEMEINKDIENENIAQLFTDAIETGYQVRELFESLSEDRDHKEEYGQMLQFVRQIKSARFGFLN